MIRLSPRFARVARCLACAGAVLLAARVAAVEAPVAAPAPLPVRIGLVAPLTGPSADFGTSMRQGAELAVDEINSMGGLLGRPLELVVRDDQGDPAAGRAAALELVSRGNLAATLGFCNTGVALNALDVFESRHQVLVVPCAQGTAITRRVPASGSMVFRVAPSDALNAEFLVDEIVERRRLARVAVLADTTGYGEGGVADVTAQLHRRGLAPVHVGRFAPGAPSLRDELEAARSAGAQALVVWTVGPGQAAAVAARAAMKWDVAYLAPWALSFRSVLETAGAAALEGTVMTQSVIPDFATDSRVSFLARYAKHTGHRPTGSLMAAAQAYDSVHLLVRALFATHGDSSGRALKYALENPSQAYHGVVSTYERPFSATDHEAFSLNMISLGTWRGGELHYYYANDARLSAAVRRKQGPAPAP